MIFYKQLRTNMRYRNLLLLILTVVSGLLFFTYSNNTYLTLKNQKTLLNFLDNNNYNLEFKLDLSDDVFSSFFNSDYIVHGSAQIYKLNHNVAGIINLGFDYLKFEQLNFSFLLEGSDFYFRITNNTFSNNFDFLSKSNWQYLDTKQINSQIDLPNILSYIALSDFSSDTLLLYPSSKALEENFIFGTILNDLQVFVSENKGFAELDFFKFSIDAHDFNGSLPIVRPQIFENFNTNLIAI